MDQWRIVISAVLPVFGVVGIGLLVRKLNWLSEEADHSLLRLNINLLMPALILDAALGNSALSRPANLFWAPLVGFSTIVLGMLLGLAAARWQRGSDSAARRTFAVSTGVYNYAYLALPLVLLLFPGNETAGVLFLHNVGVEAALWTVGVMLLTGRSAGRDWRKIINPPLVAILVALASNLAGITPHVPAPLLTAIHWLGQCAIPMALILIGAVIADHLAEFHSDWGLPVMASAVALRILLLPVLFLVLARYLPVSVELRRIMVLQAAMPAAVFPIVIARHYGGHPPTALRVVIATCLASLLTTPLWIRFGLSFAGL